MDLSGIKSRKACIVKSGPKKGKLKKGFRFSKAGRCVKAKAAKSSMRKMTKSEARRFGPSMRAAAKRRGSIVGSF
jgi:hypothetical protein